MKEYVITLITECENTSELDRVITRLDKIVPPQVKHIISEESK